jgi:hypothetical protein
MNKKALFSTWAGLCRMGKNSMKRIGETALAKVHR